MSQVRVECGPWHETSVALRGRLSNALAGPSCAPTPPDTHLEELVHTGQMLV